MQPIYEDADSAKYQAANYAGRRDSPSGLDMVKASKIISQKAQELTDELTKLGFDIGESEAPLLISLEGDLWLPECDDLHYVNGGYGAWRKANGEFYRAVPNIRNPMYDHFVGSGQLDSHPGLPDDPRSIPSNAALARMPREDLLELLMQVVEYHTYASIGLVCGVTGPTIKNWLASKCSPDTHHFARIKRFLKQYRDGKVQTLLRPARRRAS